MLTPRTITDPRRLEAELERVRRQGHALNREESQCGLFGVAVPLRADEEVVASLALSLRSRSAVRPALAALQATAPAISRALAAT